MKNVFIIAALILVTFAFSLPGQRGRYAGEPSVVRAGQDTYFAIKTIVKTISVNDDDSADDFQFDDDAGDTFAQNLNMGVLIPAWCEITSSVVRCLESVGSGTFQIILGVSSGNNELLAQSTIGTLNEFVATAATASPIVATTAAAQNIWIQGDPDAGTNWTGVGAGRWVVMVTYIDYGAVYAAGGQ